MTFVVDPTLGNLLLAKGPLVYLPLYIFPLTYCQWFKVAFVKVLNFKRAEDRNKTELCSMETIS